MTIAYLSLGSNMGDREAWLAKALELLESPALRVLRHSSIYETEPQELRDQPWFLNLVVEIETSLRPASLLRRIQDIEQKLGRERLIPNGPRTVDIDILLYGELVIDSAELQIPHPRMPQRRFVLEPLAELAPDLKHAVTGDTVQNMLERVPTQTAIRYSRQIPR